MTTKTVYDFTTKQVLVVELTPEETAERESMQPTAVELLQQQRAQMILTPASARIKLASLSMLTSVNAAIYALPETDVMRIKWEYATQIERLDPDLIAFCTTSLGLSDVQIDGLFM